MSKICQSNPTDFYSTAFHSPIYPFETLIGFLQYGKITAQKWGYFLALEHQMSDLTKTSSCQVEKINLSLPSLTKSMMISNRKRMLGAYYLYGALAIVIRNLAKAVKLFINSKNVIDGKTTHKETEKKSTDQIDRVNSSYKTDNL